MENLRTDVQYSAESNCIKVFHGIGKHHQIIGKCILQYGFSFAIKNDSSVRVNNGLADSIVQCQQIIFGGGELKKKQAYDQNSEGNQKQYPYHILS
jgi:hypothetical protein